MQQFDKHGQEYQVGHKRQPIELPNAKIFLEIIPFSSKDELFIQEIRAAYINDLTEDEHEFIVNIERGGYVIKRDKHAISEKSIPSTHKKIMELGAMLFIECLHSPIFSLTMKFGRCFTSS
jgi:hypothetical protein